MPGYAQWLRCWRELGGSGVKIPDDLYEDLIAHYSQPHRHYHTLQHLDECLGHFAGLRHQAGRPAEIELALWFHDAIYEPARHDNERQSADWAAESIKTAGLDGFIAERVHKLILATRHQEQPESLDAKILLDCDLAILGANPVRFLEYEQQIRAEYAFVPETIFKTKRAEILQQFLARPAIFNTGLFYKRYEAQARTNLIHATSLLI